MFKTIKNALKTPDVRKKLLYTLVLIIIFRFGCFITVPGVDTIALGEQMQSATGSLTGLINTISGGATARPFITRRSSRSNRTTARSQANCFTPRPASSR